MTGTTDTPARLDVVVADGLSVSGNGEPVVNVTGRGCLDVVLLCAVVTVSTGDPEPLIVPSPGVMVVYPPIASEKVGCIVTKTTVTPWALADDSVGVGVGDAVVTSAVTWTVARIVVWT